MKYESIPVALLDLDTENFRLPPQRSQKEALRHLLDDQAYAGGGNGIVNLARDIADHGVSPADLMVVVPIKGTERFRVVEGNRRLAALRLLNDAQLAEEMGVEKRLTAARTDYQRVSACFCVVFDRKTEARLWIDRKHRGQMKGVGTVDWNAVQQARAEGTREVAILDFILSRSDAPSVRLAVGRYDFPVSTLKRAGGALKETLGLSYEDGEVSLAKEDFYPVLERFVVELGTGVVDVNALFYRADIDAYLNKLIAEAAGGDSEPSDEDDDERGGGGENPGRKGKGSGGRGRKGRSRRTDDTATRKRLIPRSCNFAIPDGKTADIYNELKFKLDVETNRNSVAVLTRVFIELSLDELIVAKSISLPVDRKGNVRDRLSDKLAVTLTHLEKSGRMDRKKAKTIRVAIQNRDSFGSTETLNAYVHDKSFNPDPLQLKLTWNNYQAFLQAVWDDLV